MVTTAQVSQFREANKSLVQLALKDFAAFWGALSFASDASKIRNLLIEFMPDLVQSYGDTAAVIGADWYDELRGAPPSAASFRAVMAQPPQPAQVEGSVRWGVGPLFELAPDVPAAYARISGAAQRLILQAGRDSVIGSASRDHVRTGWARIPVGVTCRWCTMLASRGFVYKDADTAGQARQFHDFDDCVIIPGRDKSQLPEGYDLATFERAYVHGEGIGRDIPAD